MNQFEAGQKLWCVFVNRYHGNSGEVEITKVGRKWLDLSNGYRANITTLRLDGGSYNSPGQCHLSREVWETENVRQCRWKTFRNRVSGYYQCPDGVKTEQIDAAMKILGMIPEEGVEAAQEAGQEAGQSAAAYATP